MSNDPDPIDSGNDPSAKSPARPIVLAILAAAVIAPGCAGPPEVRSEASPEPSSEAVETEPMLSESAKPEPERIDDGVVTIRPKRVRPGATMTIVIRNPPGSYGLAWFLHRKQGSEWTYIGGFRAGPPGQWKDHEFNRFYFLPRWSNIGIESIAFDENDSIALKVPRLEASTYRVTGAFYRKTGREWHVDKFKVLNRRRPFEHDA